MLVFSLPIFSAITLHLFMFLSSTYNIYSSFLHRPKIRKPSHRDCINVPLTFCCEYDGCFTNCISLYYWFIVARCLGLFHCLSPRCAQKERLQSNQLIVLILIFRSPGNLLIVTIADILSFLPSTYSSYYLIQKQFIMKK